MSIQLRREFEAWAAQSHVPYHMAKSRNGTSSVYATARTQYTFEGYVAGRAGTDARLPACLLQASFDNWAQARFGKLVNAKYPGNFAKYGSRDQQHAYEGFCVGFLEQRPLGFDAAEHQSFVSKVQDWLQAHSVQLSEWSELQADEYIARALAIHDVQALVQDLPHAWFRAQVALAEQNEQSRPNFDALALFGHPGAIQSFALKLLS
jgi:hypothetical protein